MPYKRPCKSCNDFFKPTSKTTLLCDACWDKSMKGQKGKKRKEIDANRVNVRLIKNVKKEKSKVKKSIFMKKINK